MKNAAAIWSSMYIIAWRKSRVAIRNIRRDSHNDMRDFEKEKLISEDELERGEDDCKN